MSQEEKDALAEFAGEYGRFWKRALRHSWMNGSYPGIRSADACTLASLRNASYFGPRGLDDYRLTGDGS